MKSGKSNQPRPKGLLAFQYGGSGGTGKSMMADSRKKISL